MSLSPDKGHSHHHRILLLILGILLFNSSSNHNRLSLHFGTLVIRGGIQSVQEKLLGAVAGDHVSCTLDMLHQILLVMTKMNLLLDLPWRTSISLEVMMAQHMKLM
jgi:hypothetical protein